MASELRIERRYKPDRERETRALMLVLGMGPTAGTTPSLDLLDGPQRDRTERALTGEGR